MDDAFAYVGGKLATGLREVTSDPAALDSSGWWAVVVTYEGKITCARFADVRQVERLPGAAGHGPTVGEWSSSLDEAAYIAGVERIRAAIADGIVYQANLCRILSAPIQGAAGEGAAGEGGAGKGGLTGGELAGLGVRLERGNPAPYAMTLNLPGLQIASASPELYLSRDHDRVASKPIKGTAHTAEAFLPKDKAENVMIVDLVRNDLGRVAEIGSVKVPALCAVEEHPGLVHYVSTVTCRLEPPNGWPELIAASFPPGSVTGAPKASAVSLLNELEPVPRGPYCGAIGWVDADSRRGALAVGIRTFWAEDGLLKFGTGAGITWGSDPKLEWQETELKAARLLEVAGSEDLAQWGPVRP